MRQGEWGVRYESEEEAEEERRAEFCQTVLSASRSQLRILQQSYQVATGTLSPVHTVRGTTRVYNAYVHVKTYSSAQMSWTHADTCISAEHMQVFRIHVKYMDTCGAARTTADCCTTNMQQSTLLKTC